MGFALFFLADRLRGFPIITRNLPSIITPRDVHPVFKCKITCYIQRVYVYDCVNILEMAGDLGNDSTREKA